MLKFCGDDIRGANEFLPSSPPWLLHLTFEVDGDLLRQWNGGNWEAASAPLEQAVAEWREADEHYRNAQRLGRQRGEVADQLGANAKEIERLRDERRRLLLEGRDVVKTEGRMVNLYAEAATLRGRQDELRQLYQQERAQALAALRATLEAKAHELRAAFEAAWREAAARLAKATAEAYPPVYMSRGSALAAKDPKTVEQLLDEAGATLPPTADAGADEVAYAETAA